MTTPPLPTEALLTLDRLALWAQERPLLDPEFGDLVIEAVTVLLRQFGSPNWTMANLPPRARDIGYIVAKDYYLNPRQLRQETTGPLQESVDDSTLNGINLTEDQKAELAGLVDDAPGTTDGLWTMGFERGVDSTIYPGRGRPQNVLLWDTRGGWPIEYLDPSEGVVFEPEVT